MRPVVTITLLFAIVAVIAYFVLKQPARNPREELFINSYVELMLLWSQSDTASQAYLVKRDSILTQFGLTDSSLVALKRELNSDPERLIDVWDAVEQRLKARRESLGLPSGTDSTKE